MFFSKDACPDLYVSLTPTYGLAITEGNDQMMTVHVFLSWLDAYPTTMSNRVV
jgi:hypothetical protein